MADSHMTTLTDDEREELEALRAEKARREEEERARAEREELEALRAEQAKVDAQILAECAATREHRSAQDPLESASSRRATAGVSPAPADHNPPQDKTFGQRMVTSSDVDGDGIPTMPVAQKIIIAAALANGVTRVACDTTCADIDATIRCLAALGARITLICLLYTSDAADEL